MSKWGIVGLMVALIRRGPDALPVRSVHTDVCSYVTNIYAYIHAYIHIYGGQDKIEFG